MMKKINIMNELEFVFKNISYLLPFYCSVYYFFNCSNYYSKKLGRYRWDCFTRIMSTFNALQCCYMSYYVICNNVGIWKFTQNIGDLETRSLLCFASYLAVDGILQLPDLMRSFSPSLVLSIIHHFVGGYGIYSIGVRKIGLFLGVYFALTEISTPLLNLSWWCHKNKLKYKYVVFVSFYILFTIFRILSIPLLYLYVTMNSEYIFNLVGEPYILGIYGTLALVTLNSIWFLMLTKKIIGEK